MVTVQPIEPSAVRRVAVIGCSGAGKSRLASELAKRLGLPIVHLDAHYWLPGWAPTPEDEWVARQADLLSDSTWSSCAGCGTFVATLARRPSRSFASSNRMEDASSRCGAALRSRPSFAPWLDRMPLYFAYGSNLSTARIRQADRAPSARPLGTATLSGHVLAWHKRGADGSGKCTVRKTGNRSDGVWGVLWEIEAGEVACLDAVEGPGYERVEVEVTTANQKMRAFTYLARDSQVDATLRPDAEYHALVVMGAREHGLPAAWIRVLEAAGEERAPTWSESSAPTPRPAPSHPDAKR